MSEKRVIEVVPYDPIWKEEFNKIKSMLENILGDLIISIEHVGSTSVEGMWAKAIIDLDVVMESYDIFPEILEKLNAVGYTHVGDLGIKGREAFKRNCKDEFMSYHLYVCPKDGKGFLEHVALRNHLRLNPIDRDRYSDIKRKLAQDYTHEIEKYIDGKTEIITEILNKTIYKSNKAR